MLMRKIARACAVRQQYRYIVVRKAGFLQLIDYLGRLLFALRNTKKLLLP